MNKTSAPRATEHLQVNGDFWMEDWENLRPLRLHLDKAASFRMRAKTGEVCACSQSWHKHVLQYQDIPTTMLQMVTDKLLDQNYLDTIFVP